MAYYNGKKTFTVLGGGGSSIPVIEKNITGEDFETLTFTSEEFETLLSNPNSYVLVHFLDSGETTDAFTFPLKQIKNVNVNQTVVALEDIIVLYGGGSVGGTALNLKVTITQADDGTVETNVEETDIYGGESGVTIISLSNEDELIPSEHLGNIDKCVLNYNGELYHCVLDEEPDYEFQYISDYYNVIKTIHVDNTDGSWHLKDERKLSGAPIVEIYDSLSYGDDLTTLNITLNEEQVETILQDLEHTILKLHNASSSGLREVYFYYVGTTFGTKYYHTISQGVMYGLSGGISSGQSSTLSIYKIESGISEEEVNQQLETKQNKLTAGKNVSIVDNVISAEGGAPITAVEELPEATEEEYNKHKLYLSGSVLKFLAKETLSEPMNEGEIASVSTLNTSYFIVATSNENDIYFINYQSLYKFNTTTKEITTLYTLSSGNFGGAGLAFYDNKIYIFGGYGLAGQTFGSSAVYTYDILNDEMTQQTNRLSTNYITNTECCIVGRYAYIFGGYTQTKTMGSSTPNNSYTSSIHKYDLTTFTCSSLSIKLPEAMAYCKSIAYGTDIYIFGGYGNSTKKALQTILKFDTLTNTLTTLETTLPVGLQKMGAVLYNDKIYIFGGSDYNYETSTSADSNVMYEFDPKTETIKTLETTIGAVRRSFGGALSGQSIYLVGGASMNDISKMAFGEVLVYKTIKTEE